MRSRYIDEYEVRALRAHLRPQDWLPFAVALETGLRIGDLVKLRWYDITGRQISFVAEKTGKAGQVTVSRSLARELIQERRRARSEWVFPSPRDASRHITRQALWKRLKSAGRRAALPMAGVSPHSLRKVRGVEEYRKHGLAAAQGLLQHSDASTTEIYALSDWLTGKTANLPLVRSDLLRIVRLILEHLATID